MKWHTLAAGKICSLLLSLFLSSGFLSTLYASSQFDFSESPLSKDILEHIAQSHTWRALLHFRAKSSLIGQDSGFFISPSGAKNAKDELLATLQAFGVSLNEAQSHPLPFSESKLCSYPARAMYLSKFFPEVGQRLEAAQCAAYEEFLSIVPSDRISLVFAGESDVYPGSAMGHIFLALEGEAREDIYKKFENRSEINLKKGQYVGYSLGFFANTELGLNPISYIRAIIGNLNGVYALQPLDNNEFEYLENEKRSLWRLELKLDSKQKALLMAHLWELKDIPVDYAFITHNCNDALKIVLGVADSAFDVPKIKPYQTPTEYIKALDKAQLITHTEVQNPQSKQSFIKAYGQNDIFQMRDSAKLSLSWSGGSFDSTAHLYFAPIYSDILNANHAYKEYIESRLFSLEAAFNLRHKSAMLRRIEALHLFSVNDTFRTKELAKYIDITLETPIWEQRKTSLQPRASFGLGVGSYMGRLSLYVLPILGYEYIRGHNAFLDMRVGVLLRLPRIQLVGSYEHFLDLNQSLRGYKQKLNVHAGINLYKQFDVYVQGSLYPKGEFCAMSIGFVGFECQNLYGIGAGISANF